MNIIIVAAAVISLGGCMPEREPGRVEMNLPDKFSAEGTDVLPEKWWQSLEDPQLSELIEQAVGDNFTIRAAWDRLEQARQEAIKAGADHLPAVNYDGSAGRSVTERGSNRNYTTDYNLGLSLGYEVDLWGRIKSIEQAAVYDAQAREHELAAAAITLSSTIAGTWYQYAEACRRVEVIERQLGSNRQVLELITLQFKKAQASAADVFRQRQLVESSNGRLIQARQSCELLQYQLSILAGKAPGKHWPGGEAQLIELSRLPQVSIPSELILRRPDIAGAYKSVLAADERAAASIANQYPSLRITAAAQTGGESTSDIFDDWLANIAAGVTGPLFDGGSRKAEVERSRARLSEAINSYSQTVLESLKEVEDALAAEDYQRQFVESVRSQLDLSRDVFERTRESFIKGQFDYIRVLESLVSQQSLELSELQARRVLIEKRIDLCKAIAGGWQMKKPQQAVLIYDEANENQSPM
ncbi:efflux transporter outer membrane subunit [Limihaloglobus sulfuriphilus]|nr:efflux transporter outer membrane subunit [Limihaloglobus sulfuriphilus]